MALSVQLANLQQNKWQKKLKKLVMAKVPRRLVLSVVQ